MYWCKTFVQPVTYKRHTKHSRRKQFHFGVGGGGKM